MAIWTAKKKTILASSWDNVNSVDFLIISEDFNIFRGNLQYFVVETSSSILCVDFYKIMDKATMLAGGVAVSNFGLKFSHFGNLWNDL